MGTYWLNVALLRLFLPVILTVCAVWRPTGLSIIYLALMLYLPIVPIPTSKTMSGHTGRYLTVAMGLCFLTVITQIAFQIVLLSLQPYGGFLENCKFLEILLRHVGLIRLDQASTWIIFYWLTPELIVLPSVILVYIVCRKLTLERRPEEGQQVERKEPTSPSPKVVEFLGTVGTYVVLFSLCCTGTLQPSVEGGLYFLLFIGAGTLWACNTELRRGFAIICRLVMVYVLVHVVVILSYQNPWPQELVPKDSQWARYFALIPVYTTNCTNPREVDIAASNWVSFTEPVRLIWLYYILALQSQFLVRKPEKKVTRFSGKLENLDTPLSRHVSARRRSPSQRWQSARRKARGHYQSSESQPDETTPLMRFGSGRAGLLQDSTGSVILQDGHHDDSIQMQSISDGTAEDQPGVFEQIIMAFYAIFQLIIQSSYLATNIVMMAWSITYHSWTTFVLLLWAIILWMVPNKRSWMMKCSPFIVIYATLLLLVQFVFNLNLNNDELPDKIDEVELSQIGFTKTSKLGSWHLLVKCLYTTMFWITMRQYMAERKQQRRSSALRDMVAPLHVSVSTATTAMQQDMPEIRSKFMKDLGMWTQKILTKFWIAVVAIMLFTSGITGERMTVFRIIYMSLFLIFVITFQISWSAWRRMMYGFWIAVIAFSVIMLILVYTYQFHNFPTYWEKIGVDQDLQMDIGLEGYETKDLFVRLLTPTFFVIITVVQMHYFHKDFLKVTDIETIRPVVPDVSEANPGQSSADAPDEAVPQSNVIAVESEEDHRTMYTLRQLKQMSKIERKALFQRALKHLHNFYNHIWLFLEIHMEKIIFSSMMLLCISEVCAIHFLFVLTVVIAINLRRGVQIVLIKVMAAVIALLMVVKMVYQIKYIKHNDWDRNCTDTLNETINETGLNFTTYNIAEWIGMKKAAPGGLPLLLKGYIGIITITTVRGIILVRQMFYRQARGLSLKVPLIMFPNITRKDADKGIIECLKFLFNYGFYKFGLEFCFIGIIALISTRLDFYSVLYAFWLGLLYCFRRPTVAKLWPIFQCFGILLLPIQYFIVVAPPTWLCIPYPWDKNELLRRLQEWMFFPDPDYPPNSRKLLCDFFLLLMITRQRLVFYIEASQKDAEEEYPGGHNYSVFKDIEKPHFVNPASDFVSQAHNWLDVIKRGILSSLLWISLSIMFLAGTKRTNLFSLGYLVGAFVFLWQGSDFYLRPIRTILKWWNVLIGYNITVIMLKAILQGIGCLYIKEVELSACWLIQLLGIACLKKFKSNASGMIQAAECQVPREDIGMVWDGMCFAFLIMQKRLFKSYYFFHIVDETKAMSILASRGAELLEELHQKRIEAQESMEKTILEKLKFKMDKIKANQKKILGPVYKDSISHRTDGAAPLARSPSASSCVSSGHTPPQGYQTPIDEDEPAPLTPRAASLLQAPTPNSAIMTVSLEGYLEPTRISFGSPPSSELNPRGPSPDESFPVFSPPPYDQTRADQQTSATRHRRQSSFVGPPWLNLHTPRQSIISTTSRSPHSHHTYLLYPGTRPLYRRRPPVTNREAVRSGDYYMFDDMDDDDVSEFVADDQEPEEPDRRQKRAPHGRRMTMSELVNTVLKTDIEIATHVALHGGTQQDALQIRRRSEPMTRKKSSMSYLSARSESDTAAPVDERDDAGSMDSAEVEAVEREMKGEDLTRTPMPSDEDDEDVEEKKKISVFTYFKFVWAFVNSAIVSITKHLNLYSRDYRYIRKVLTAEKKILKQKPDFRTGTRLGISQIWQPITKTQQASSSSTNAASTDEPSEEDARSVGQPRRLEDRKESSLTVPHIRILAPSLERGLDMSSSSTSSRITLIVRILVPGFKIWLLGRAFDVLSLLIHKSSTDDERIIILYKMTKHENYSRNKNSIISQMTLTNPEEDQGELSEKDQPPIIQLLASIWFVILAHSNLLCYFMVFLHQIKNASVLSLPLPLMVFLWGTLTIPRPSKTFWVTLIAYTEIVVIVKCIFQFERLPWNQEVAGSKPFFAPRIIGIERKPNYALWDLLLLLIVFFHRLMLKSLGQWNTSSPKPRMVVPSHLTIDNTQTPPVADNRGQGEQTTTRTEDVLLEENNQIRRESLRTSGDERDHSPSPGDTEGTLTIRAEEVDPCNEKLTTAIGLTARKYLEPTKIYFKSILNASGKEKTNVYAYMFFCDFFNFLLIIFGFSAFGTQQGDGGVAAYLADNRVPMPFLLMLLLQFGLIVIDRALFLRKYILGKLIFQYCLVVGIHMWMFFILPSVTERAFNEKLPPQIWYMVKCFYLLLAAYQLRLGYPTRILGNFLCKKYSIVNYCLFKVFMIVPFLFELRAVMDWIWTDTSMTIMDWFKMEDIFASIYQLKCMRGVETDFPQPRGTKKAQTSKYLVGGIALFLMIGMIWFPLLLFALGGTVGVSNLPYEVSMKLRIGSYEPIYAMSAQNTSIYRYSEGDYENLESIYAKDRSATTFLENYIASDIAVVKLSPSSRRLWAISPPDLKRLIHELNSTDTLTFHVEWTVSRKTDAQDASEKAPMQRDIALLPTINGQPNPLRLALLDMLDPQNENENKTIMLTNAFPKFLKVTSRLISTVPQLMNFEETVPEDESDDSYLYRNITLQLSRNNKTCCAPQEWWIVKENCSDIVYQTWLHRVPQNGACDGIVMFLFNDKAFPKELSFISGFGILGLYTTAVILVSQMLRKNVSEMAPKIMFDDLPYVDRILRLCLDIYLVRESGELCLEEDLFAKLIFLYRSPETLIRWTRPPEPGEQADDNEDGNAEEAEMRIG